MKNIYSLLGIAVLCAVPAIVAAQTVVGSQTVGGRRVEMTADSAAKRVISKVYEGKYSYVRIEEREPGAAPNRHPFSVSPHALRNLLESVSITVDGKPEPIFNADQLDEISGPLSQALARALPEQDISFATSGLTSSSGLFASRSVTTARVFALDKSIEIVFGLGQRDFENEMRGTGVLIAFEPGQRGQRVDPSLQVSAPQTTRRRADWLGVDLSRLEQGARSETPPAAVVGTSIGNSAAAPAPAQVAPRAAASGNADMIYNNLSERFKALQKLRDAGLITDAEFEAKRKSLLGEL
jgi:hypothetical protein